MARGSLNPNSEYQQLWIWLCLNLFLTFIHLQERDLSDRKEKDFTLAIQARDEAFNECQKVKGQIQVMEEREKQKVKK